MLSKVLELELIMVLLILTGVFLRRKGALTDEGRDCITDILMQVVLPCNIFLSFQMEVSADVFSKFGTTMLISLLIMIGVTVIGKLCYRNQPERRAKVFRYGLINSNALFIGMPVVQSLLGDEGVIQQNMYMIFVRMFCWSYGLSLYTGTKADWKSSAKRLVTHPCMVATLLGVCFMAADISLPSFAQRTLNYCSSCLMVLSMFLIGAVLANLDGKKLFRRDIWGFSVLRLVIVPGFVALGCRLFAVDFVVTATCVLMAAMPAASLTAVLAARYHADEELGALIVTLSTVLSVISIPLWFLILQ